MNKAVQRMKAESRRMFHGTRRSFKQFSTKKGEKVDFLGNWLHFADDPAHAARVATEGKAKKTKHGKVVVPPKPDVLTARMRKVRGLNVRPVEVTTTNPLDLSGQGVGNKLIRDAEALMRAVPKKATKGFGGVFLRQALREAQHQMKRPPRDKDDAAYPYYAGEQLRTEMLRLAQMYPKAVRKAGFDAVRYIDQPGWGRNKATAVPSSRQVKPAFGRVVEPPPKPRKFEHVHGGLQPRDARGRWRSW